MNIFEKFSEKLNIKKKKISNGGMTAPIDFNPSRNEFLDSLSKKALKLYEKQNDIKNFSKLVLADPENTSHEARVQDLLKKGIIDPLEDEKLEQLADNAKLLRDLGLLE